MKHSRYSWQSITSNTILSGRHPGQPLADAVLKLAVRIWGLGLPWLAREDRVQYLHPWLISSWAECSFHVHYKESHRSQYWDSLFFVLVWSATCFSPKVHVMSLLSFSGSILTFSSVFHLILCLGRCPRGGIPNLRPPHQGPQ